MHRSTRNAAVLVGVAAFLTLSVFAVSFAGTTPPRAADLPHIVSAQTADTSATVGYGTSAPATASTDPAHSGISSNTSGTGGNGKGASSAGTGSASGGTTGNKNGSAASGTDTHDAGSDGDSADDGTDHDAEHEVVAPRIHDSDEHDNGRSD